MGKPNRMGFENPRRLLGWALIGLGLLAPATARAGNVNETEPNDGRSDPGVLVFVPGLDGLYGNLDGPTLNDDYWEFTATAGTQYTFVANAINCRTFVNPPLDLGIEIQNASGGVVTGQDLNGDCLSETLVWTPSASGTYYIAVYEATGTPSTGITSYRIDIFKSGPTFSPSPTPMPTISPSPTVSPTPSPIFTEKDINLVSYGLAANPVSGHIYASVVSWGGREGNTVAVIDPTKGEVQAHLFVGSDPTDLVVTEGGEYLYTLLEGGAAVLRTDLATYQRVRFTLGNDPVEGPRFPVDQAPMKGAPLSLAVSSVGFTTAFVSGLGARIYDNGVPRSNAGPLNAVVIERSDIPNTVYASDCRYNQDNFYRLNAAFDGLGTSATATFSGIGNSELEYENGKVYSTKGGVINTTNMTMASTFPATSRLQADSANNRMFTLATKVLTSRVLGTGALLDTENVAATNRSYSELIRWGSNGLAFIQDSTTIRILEIIDPTLLPQSANPAPAKPTGIAPVPDLPIFQLQGADTISIATNDLVHDPLRDILYVSVPDSDPLRGGTITQIDPATGAFGASVNVGSEPNVMAISPDSSRLYVGLDGVNQVRLVDLATFTAGTTFSLGTLIAGDIAIDPLTSSTLAISELTSDTMFRRLAIYDDGVARPDFVDANDGYQALRVEYNADGTMLYAVDNAAAASPFYRFVPGPTGIANPAAIPAIGKFLLGDIQFENGILYSSLGEFADPATPALIGTYKNAGLLLYNSALVADSGRGFTYSSSSGKLLMHNHSRFLRIANLTVPAINSAPLRIVTCGQEDAAVRLVDKIVIARINHINAADEWIQYE